MPLHHHVPHRPHLCWTLENLVEGKVVNQIKVDAETRKWALVALDRMLSIKGAGSPTQGNPTPMMSQSDAANVSVVD